MTETRCAELPIAQRAPSDRRVAGTAYFFLASFFGFLVSFLRLLLPLAIVSS